MEQKICSKCKTTKFLTNEFFYHDKYKKSGFQSSCIECQTTNNVKYRVDHSEYFKKKGKENYKKEDNSARYQKTRENFLKRRKEWYNTIKGRMYDLFSAARERARKKNLPIDIDLEYLLELYETQNKQCALTGMDFILEEKNKNYKRFTPFGPSIDKIDHTKGYTKDNIRLVCVMVNLSLNTFGDECFDKMCEAYIKKKNNL